ncbi:hypothetical protein P7C70_g7135, partial [Phenoliferia sp. Uapishka_3]
MFPPTTSGLPRLRPIPVVVQVSNPGSPADLIVLRSHGPVVPSNGVPPSGAWVLIRSSERVNELDNNIYHYVWLDNDPTPQQGREPVPAMPPSKLFSEEDQDEFPPIDVVLARIAQQGGGTNKRIADSSPAPGSSQGPSGVNKRSRGSNGSRAAFVAAAAKRTPARKTCRPQSPSRLSFAAAEAGTWKEPYWHNFAPKGPSYSSEANRLAANPELSQANFQNLVGASLAVRDAAHSAEQDAMQLACKTGGYDDWKPAFKRRFVLGSVRVTSPDAVKLVLST